MRRARRTARGRSRFTTRPDRPDARHRRPSPPPARYHANPRGARLRTRVLSRLRWRGSRSCSPARAPRGRPSARAPLAERMRPRTLDEFVGQQHLLGPGRVLRDMLDGGHVESLILWGPPGQRQDDARAPARRGQRAPRPSHFSAVLQGVRELRQVVDEAEAEQRRSGRRRSLFVDEIHRFNKAQQDAFLPHVEAGTIMLDRRDDREPVVRGDPAAPLAHARARARAARRRRPRRASSTARSPTASAASARDGSRSTPKARDFLVGLAARRRARRARTRSSSPRASRARAGRATHRPRARRGGGAAARAALRQGRRGALQRHLRVHQEPARQRSRRRASTG